MLGGGGRRETKALGLRGIHSAPQPPESFVVLFQLRLEDTFPGGVGEIKRGCRQFVAGGV